MPAGAEGFIKQRKFGFDFEGAQRTVELRHHVAHDQPKHMAFGSGELAEISGFSGRCDCVVGTDLLIVPRLGAQSEVCALQPLLKFLIVLAGLWRS